ncbi:hypothetical protein [Caballeronia calidae]|uniref:hypothetical protein n=1 Tax=Caballeronia calidae TaxID=1777139 RepID=UPI000940A21E|nr:hypothetical protein [Caballeronia calidae]
MSVLPLVQAAILVAKRENTRRSIRQIRLLLEGTGVVPRDTLSKSAIHRLLKVHGLAHYRIDPRARREAQLRGRTRRLDLVRRKRSIRPT